MCRRFPPRLPGLCSVSCTRMPRRWLLAGKGPSGARFLYATALRAVLRCAAPVRRVALSRGLTYDRTATASPFRERFVSTSLLSDGEVVARQARRSDECLFDDDYIWRESRDQLR